MNLCDYDLFLTGMKAIQAKHSTVGLNDPDWKLLDVTLEYGDVRGSNLMNHLEMCIVIIELILPSQIK